MRAFDKIAGDWDAYKKGPLSAMKLFLPYISRGDAVLDAGCGNGRNLITIARKVSSSGSLRGGTRIVGVDSSREMLAHARKNAKAAGLTNASFFLQDIARKSARFKPGTFDKIVCLAVLHHLRTTRQRRAAFREFSRLLRTGGLLLVSVWNRHQKKFEGGGPSDRFVPFTVTGGKKVRRFYHFFEKDGLEELAKSGGFSIADVFYESRGARAEMEGAANLCVVLRK